MSCQFMKNYQLHSLTCDVLVAGGGPSGVPCAIAAARQGAKVILCQDRPVLGGNASSEVRMHIVGANSSRPINEPDLEARETGIIEEIRLENSYRNPTRSPSLFDLILYEKCRAEPNITLMLNTSVVDAVTENGVITSAEAIRPTTEDRFVIKAKVFVDCTGDGGLGAAAGAPFFRGRESKDDYGESMAQDQRDNKSLGSTLLFMGRKHDHPVPFIAPPWARKFTEEDLRLRTHARPGVDSGLEYGYWWMEWGGELDTIKDGEVIRDELLAIVMGIWDHIKNDGDHDAEYWSLDWFGMVPGKRESRRFVGQHVLTQNDVMESRAFEDAIAYGGWPIDTHPPEGVDAPHLKPCDQTPVPRLYDIPLRVCVSNEVKNLMFAGRNVSATHIAFATTRVMATCALMGEGVGVAAAYSVQNNVQPIDIAGNEQAVKEIRQRLLREDCYLIGEVLDESSNLVSQATITASSEQADGPASNILSGQNRVVSNDRGVAPERQLPGTHRWKSDPAAGLPAWLAFEWEQPQTIRELEIVFDSGLLRYLTLSQSQSYADLMHWGKGQPEMVRNFEVEVLDDSGWRSLQKVENQWQRRWRYVAEGSPLQIKAWRIRIDSTWGADHARVVRAAAYS